MAEGSSPKLLNVPDVEIDANGRFKYVLIKVIDGSHDGAFKYIVRGSDWADYHGKLVNRHMFHTSFYASLHKRTLSKAAARQL